ncbi:uncharacterized protein RCC_06213 [Ramularia collo-cygni]|uniref:Uncharacterized protein n=1 Tax=Ramularia collo-cygni TaxID=112498 RepID=A0A2D3VCA1_9PEZI|nr:uncharacterized protein RCC_06213 [Ramularia collo-cygni]CZT20354.1 uncharacterized protein RCC_06213 [Ramularia collo-cygni]
MPENEEILIISFDSMILMMNHSRTIEKVLVENGYDLDEVAKDSGNYLLMRGLPVEAQESLRALRGVHVTAEQEDVDF